MIDLKYYTALQYDYGNFFPIAQRLARDFGETFYWMPYVHDGFPTHKPIDVGRNVPDVMRIREWASIIDEVDLVMFSDCHEPALQMFFEKQLKKKVFGSRYASELEHDRKTMKELMKSLNLPLNKYYVAEGIDELEQLLMEHENVYVKSGLRGDMESWKSINYTLSKGELQRMRNNLGVYQNKPTYIIEEPIDSIAEIGVDLVTVDGMYPEYVLTGIELKDTGFYGRIMRYAELPIQLRLVTDKLSTIFREYGYKGWFSDEVIISGDMEGYLIDPTMRCPSPPTDLALEMITNYPEVIWNTASGVLPKLQFNETHGVQLIIKSEVAKTDPVPLIIPEEFKRFVKIKNLTIDDDGTYYYTPMEVQMCEIGSVVGMGNSMQEALDMAKMIADSIKGFDIKINTDCIKEAEIQLGRLEVNGINYL